MVWNDVSVTNAPWGNQTLQGVLLEEVGGDILLELGGHILLNFDAVKNEEWDLTAVTNPNWS